MRSLASTQILLVQINNNQSRSHNQSNSETYRKMDNDPVHKIKIC